MSNSDSWCGDLPGCPATGTIFFGPHDRSVEIARSSSACGNLVFEWRDGGVRCLPLSLLVRNLCNLGCGIVLFLSPARRSLHCLAVFPGMSSAILLE